MAKDGTAVVDEDYFSTIAAQTLFIVAAHQDKVQTGINTRLSGIVKTVFIDIKL